MAGYAMGFGDGGAIPDDEDYAPAQDEQQPQGNQPTGVAAMPDVGEPPIEGLGRRVAENIGEGWENFKKNPVVRTVKRAFTEDTGNPHNQQSVLGYLMGADAAPPQAAEKFSTGLQAEFPGISEDDANLMGVHKAMELGGPAAAWAMVQYNRQAYNAKQSFALAALNGVQGKPPDVQAAAKAATQASTHVLDGSKTVFNATPDGFVTATVTMPGSDGATSYSLDPQQFAQWLNVGKDGQWDHVMENGGVPGTLQRLSRPQTEAQRTGQPIARDPTGADQPPLPGGADKMDVSTNYGDELEARADAMFGKGLNTGTQRQRQEWLAQQEEKELERQNKIDVASEKGKNDIEKARVTGTARIGAADTTGQHRENTQRLRSDSNEKVANIQADARAKSDQQKALLAAKKMEQQGNDARMRERGRMARAAISNPNFLLQTDAQRDAVYKQFGIDQVMQGATPPTGQAATPPSGQGAPAPQPSNNGSQAQRPANVPAGAKLFEGKWYTRGPNGEAVEVK
jgi:hypothetical protein